MLNFILAGKIKREKKIQEMSSSINLNAENASQIKSLQTGNDADPGVISDDDEFTVNPKHF